MTHAHPERIARAVVVEVALAFRVGEGEAMSAEQFLLQVVENARKARLKAVLGKQ